jgi:hypothetical protein
VDYGDIVQFRHTGLAQRSIIVLRLPPAAPPRAPLAGSPGGRGALSPQALYARLYRLDVGGADDLILITDALVIASDRSKRSRAVV